MRRALIASAALHLLVGLMLWAGLNGSRRPLPEPAVVAVEVVTTPPELAPDAKPTPPAPEPVATAPLPEREAAAPPRAVPRPTPEPAEMAQRPEPQPEPPAPPPPPEPTPTEAPAPPPEPEPAPQLTVRAPEPPPPPLPQPKPAEAQAEPVAAQAKPAQAEPNKTPDFALRPRPRPNPPAEVAEAARPAPSPPTPPKTQPAPPPAPPEKTDVAKEDPLDALLRSVEEVAERRRAEERRDGRGRGPAETEEGVARAADGAAQQALLASLQRMIEDQIYRCWIVPIGAEGLRGAQVVLRFALAPDGSVRGMEVVDRERFARDPVFRTVAESAIRAVYRCAPLELPGEQYALWREIEMNFDPARALGG